MIDPATKEPVVMRYFHQKSQDKEMLIECDPRYFSDKGVKFTDVSYTDNYYIEKLLDGPNNKYWWRFIRLDYTDEQYDVDSHYPGGVREENRRDRDQTTSCKIDHTFRNAGIIGEKVWAHKNAWTEQETQPGSTKYNFVVHHYNEEVSETRYGGR